MANNEFTIPIPARLKNVAKGGHVAGAKDIIDDALGKEQSEINQEVSEAIEGNTEAVAAERQRAVAAEGALDTRLSDVEELAEISIDGGEAKIATGDDFNNPTAEQRAKVTTVGAIGDNYGFYKENPEFAEVHTDADDKILYGVKKGGDFYFGAGIPSQIQEELDNNKADLADLSETKVNKEEGKSLIDEDYASLQGAIDNPEYLQTTTDSEDKILEGIKADGKRIINIPVEINADVKLGNSVTLFDKKLTRKSTGILRTRDFVIEAKKNVIDNIIIIGNTQPRPLKRKYYLTILLSEEITITAGYLNIKWDKTYDGRSEQVINITNFTNKFKSYTFEIDALHAIADIRMTLWLTPLVVNVTGRAIMYQASEDLDLNYFLNKDNYSNTSAFLASYTLGGNDNAGKLHLALSTDGMHFHKLSDNYIFNFQNPLGMIHDLDILYKDGYFYMTATTQTVVDNNVILYIYRSVDLQNWEQYSTLEFPTDSFSYNEGNTFVGLWAPEILLLNNTYYLSFGICETRTNPYIVKGYVAKLNEDFTSYTDLSSIYLNEDNKDFTFDVTFLYDKEKDVFYAYSNDGAVYQSDSLNGEWTVVGMIPLNQHGYYYMEGATILKEKGFYYIYGDGTLSNGYVANNMLCWRTPDFITYELVDEQFDNHIRHPKIIQVDCLRQAIAEKLFLDFINN